jgi:8-oxo-dGTP pyrophosphatase MutT (NUDIX family)
MSDPKRWTVEKTELLQDCRVFSVSRTRTRSPRTGQPHSFFRIDSSDWANIVPITPEGNVVMVRQYRHGADRITLETPGGLVDSGETPVEAAAREMLEETGYRASEIASLGAVSPNPALFGNWLHVFVARGSVRVAEVQPGETEETVVDIVTREQLRQFVRDGTVDHALVVAALYLLDLQEGRIGDARGGS